MKWDPITKYGSFVGEGKKVLIWAVQGYMYAQGGIEFACKHELKVQQSFLDENEPLVGLSTQHALASPMHSGLLPP